MTAVKFEWIGSEESSKGEAQYKVDGVILTLSLPDFGTANSLYILMQSAERAGRRVAILDARREVTMTLNRMEAAT